MPWKARVRASSVLMPWRAAVARQERMAQNSSAPVMERMQPEILIRNLLMRMTRSASLLVNGTRRSRANRR